MGDFVIRTYLKWQNFLDDIRVLKDLVEFLIFVYKIKILKKRDPYCILQVLYGFIRVAEKSYFESAAMNRSMKESSRLLQTLIIKYYDTKSDKVLEQIFEVLKEEFIKRGKNCGRKF